MREFYWVELGYYRNEIVIGVAKYEGDNRMVHVSCKITLCILNICVGGCILISFHTVFISTGVMGHRLSNVMCENLEPKHVCKIRHANSVVFVGAEL